MSRYTSYMRRVLWATAELTIRLDRPTRMKTLSLLVSIPSLWGLPRPTPLNTFSRCAMLVLGLKLLLLRCSVVRSARLDTKFWEDTRMTSYILSQRSIQADSWLKSFSTRASYDWVNVIYDSFFLRLVLGLLFVLFVCHGKLHWNLTIGTDCISLVFTRRILPMNSIRCHGMILLHRPRKSTNDDIRCDQKPLRRRPHPAEVIHICPFIQRKKPTIAYKHWDD